MSPDPDDWLANCLDRAAQITARLKAASGLKEMAIELSHALHSEVSRSRFVRASGPFIVPPVKLPFKVTPSWLQSTEITETVCFVNEIPGGLRGIHKLEVLLAELVATYVSPEPIPGEKRRIERPSFAFVVAALSALPNRNDLEDDFKRICVAAREQASELATSAVFASHANTFDEMHRGIQAVTQMEGFRSRFSRHVAAVLVAHRNLVEGGNIPIRKGHIREEASEILKKEGIVSYPDSAEWTDVYEAAGVKHLKRGGRDGVKRGKSRHGGSK